MGVVEVVTLSVPNEHGVYVDKYDTLMQFNGKVSSVEFRIVCDANDHKWRYGFDFDIKVRCGESSGPSIHGHSFDTRDKCIAKACETARRFFGNCHKGQSKYNNPDRKFKEALDEVEAWLKSIDPSRSIQMTLF